MARDIGKAQMHLPALPQDNKVVDHACVALSRIAESFSRSPAQLQVICEHGLIRHAVQLVSPRHFTSAHVARA